MRRLFRIFTISLIALVYASTMLAQHHNHPHQGQNIEHYSRPKVCASPQQLQDIVTYVESLSFDADKLKAIQLIVSLCPIAACDLPIIMDLFSFDDKKKEVLKAAYPYCPDKRHFPWAVEHLTFQSNKDEVYRYIADM